MTVLSDVSKTSHQHTHVYLLYGQATSSTVVSLP